MADVEPVAISLNNAVIVFVAVSVIPQVVRVLFRFVENVPFFNCSSITAVIVLLTFSGTNPLSIKYCLRPSQSFLTAFIVLSTLSGVNPFDVRYEFNVSQSELAIALIVLSTSSGVKP